MSVLVNHFSKLNSSSMDAEYNFDDNDIFRSCSENCSLDKDITHCQENSMLNLNLANQNSQDS